MDDSGIGSIRMSQQQDQETADKVFAELLKDPENTRCCDCKTKGAKWASHSIGAFLCIRCSGIHRKLGTHISRVKSLTLDSWTPEQLAHMKRMGNTKVNQQYCPKWELFVIPDNNDADMEQFIREKYERKIMMFPEVNDSRFKISASLANDPRYAADVRRLGDLGFQNHPLACVAALRKFEGNFNAAVEYLNTQIVPSTIAVKPTEKSRRYTVSTAPTSDTMKREPLQQQQVPPPPLPNKPLSSGMPSFGGDQQQPQQSSMAINPPMSRLGANLRDRSISQPPLPVGLSTSNNYNSSLRSNGCASANSGWNLPPVPLASSQSTSTFAAFDNNTAPASMRTAGSTTGSSGGMMMNIIAEDGVVGEFSDFRGSAVSTFNSGTGSNTNDYSQTGSRRHSIAVIGRDQPQIVPSASQFSMVSLTSRRQSTAFEELSKPPSQTSIFSVNTPMSLKAGSDQWQAANNLSASAQFQPLFDSMSSPYGPLATVAENDFGGFSGGAESFNSNSPAQTFTSAAANNGFGNNDFGAFSGPMNNQQSVGNAHQVNQFGGGFPAAGVVPTASMIINAPRQMMPTGNSNANNFFGQLNTQSVSAANTGNGGNNGFADFQSFQSTPQSSQMPRQLPQTVIQQQQPQWSTGGAGGNEWNGNFTSALPSNVPSFDGQQQRQRQQQMNTNPFMTSSPSSNNGLPAVQSTISNNSNNPFNTPQPAGGSNNISNFDSLI